MPQGRFLVLLANIFVLHECLICADSRRLDPLSALGGSFAFPAIVSSKFQSDRACGPPNSKPVRGSLSLSGAGLHNNGRSLSARSLSLHGGVCDDAGGASRWRFPSEASDFLLDGANQTFVSFVESVVGTDKNPSSSEVDWLYGEGNGREGRRAGTASVIWCGADRGLKRWVLIRPREKVSQAEGPAVGELGSGGRYVIAEAVDSSGRTSVCAFGEGRNAIKRWENIAEGPEGKSGPNVLGDAAQNPESDAGLRGAQIAGIVGGSLGITLMVCAVLGTVFFLRGKRHRSEVEANEATAVNELTDPDC